jgi:hypothetical protein
VRTAMRPRERKIRICIAPADRKRYNRSGTERSIGDELWGNAAIARDARLPDSQQLGALLRPTCVRWVYDDRRKKRGVASACGDEDHAQRIAFKRLFAHPIFRPVQLHCRKFISYLISISCEFKRLFGTGNDIRLPEHNNRLINRFIMIIRSTAKSIYYPRPEKQSRSIYGCRRIRYVHDALVVQPKS